MKKNEENQVKNLMYRECRKAGLPERGWHSLRHSFGTHAALFGVNPWRLMAWMGHKRIDETMLYVHVAKVHRRELAPVLVEAAREPDPDRRVLRMLEYRHLVPWKAGGKDQVGSGKARGLTCTWKRGRVDEYRTVCLAPPAEIMRLFETIERRAA